MDTIDQIAIDELQAEEDGSAPVVGVEDLYKSFGTQKVLNGISLTVKRGETLAVLGRSGTGKSVLLRLIIGLRSPTRDRFAFTVKTSPVWLSTNSARSGRRWAFCFSMPRFTIR